MLFFLGWCIIASAIIGAIIGRAHERNKWHERLLTRSEHKLDEPKRLVRAMDDLRRSGPMDDATIAQALDAIAVEVERIGEGQRFLTRVLAERERRTGGPSTSPVPGTVRSPIPPTA